MSSYGFIFFQDQVLLQSGEQGILDLQHITVDLHINQKIYLGICKDVPSYAIELASLPTDLPTELEWLSIRKMFLLLDDPIMLMMLGKAIELIYWDRRTQFCGQCSYATQYQSSQYVKSCPNCAATFFPIITPAVLALIWRDNQILLGRSPHFIPGVYSLLSGFVDVGESLEQTVIREVEEEVGIAIKNIRYVSSQPWPFPSSIMVGFIAEYAHGNLSVNHAELEDAQWFEVDNLPPLPHPKSLSRQMIQAHVQNYLQKKP